MRSFLLVALAALFAAPQGGFSAPTLPARRAGVDGFGIRRRSDAPPLRRLSPAAGVTVVRRAGSDPDARTLVPISVHPAAPACFAAAFLREGSQPSRVSTHASSPRGPPSAA